LVPFLLLSDHGLISKPLLAHTQFLFHRTTTTATAPPIMAASSTADVAAMMHDLDHGRHTAMFAAFDKGERAIDTSIVDALAAQTRKKALAHLAPAAAQKLSAWHSNPSLSSSAFTFSPFSQTSTRRMRTQTTMRRNMHPLRTAWPVAWPECPLESGTVWRSSQCHCTQSILLVLLPHDL
jgi:hypothetical protein